MKLIKYLTLAIALITLQGCANPSIVNVSQNANNIISNASNIYIPRFEGNPNFVEEGTDYYISIIENKINGRVIQGSALRLEKTDIESGGNLAPITIALEVAKQNGASILIMGKVTSYSSAGSLNGFATIRVYDVTTGDRIANFHRPSGKLMAWSEHQCMMAAVKRVAKDTLSIL